eukprot:Rmarinus@m.11686
MKVPFRQRGQGPSGILWSSFGYINFDVVSMIPLPLWRHFWTCKGLSCGVTLISSCAFEMKPREPVLFFHFFFCCCFVFVLFCFVFVVVVVLVLVVLGKPDTNV